MLRTIDRAERLPVTPARRRSRWRSVVLVPAWALCGLVTMLGLAFFAPRLPISPLQDVIGVTALFIPWLTSTLIGSVLITAVIAVWAWRSRRRALLTTSLLATVLAVLMITVPWAAASRTAEVSWSQQFAAAPTPSPTTTATYATVQGQNLQVDVYRPRQPAASKPTLVYVHGGSWNSGTRADSAPWFAWMADQGVTVFSIDYRLAPPPRWQDAVGDVKCALGWVRTKAGQYGIATANVSIAGDSAGGQLALLAAYTVGDQRFRPSCAVPEAPVKSVMGWYAPTDLPALLNGNGLPGLAASATTDFLGGDLDSQRARYDLASAINHVRAGLPPTLLIQGDRDHMIPAPQAAALAGKLNAAGVPATAVTIPWAEHNFTGQWGSWGSQIMRPHVQGFLMEHALK
ncbi:alpha/beta hydrolase [Nonomuraea endophytica]|uniref:Acetyl esterase/lipase n=1 Tax=Nonomuraea endophytica TaxID=714136 RepID=A0A7W8EJH8_9ACTN|nr:alpha/beta hydrolase [Nonomuraea endophytica]MBB5083185.1 acetyl esterase/lipase [Nonomuraea endophytica]